MGLLKIGARFFAKKERAAGSFFHTLALMRMRQDCACSKSYEAGYVIDLVQQEVARFLQRQKIKLDVQEDIEYLKML